MTDNFKDHPLSLAEVRADKAKDSKLWTARDALISVLRETKPFTEMPRYKCHKVVQALKITAVEIMSDGATLSFEEGFPTLKVNLEWAASRRPVADGFFVRYEDGYESFSPSAAFESGYTRIDP